jgi:GNAT superfamily N-acetyltransferase
VSEAAGLIRIRAIPPGSPRLQLIAELDRLCFPDDEPYPVEGAQWWLALGPGGVPLGYAGAKVMPLDRHTYLCRAGVLPQARGRGLQRRLIRTRLAWARKVGAVGCYTYTIANPASANSLISCGFRAFEPKWRWGGNSACYWIRRFG